jgi:hypothetical protein
MNGPAVNAGCRPLSCVETMTLFGGYGRGSALDLCGCHKIDWGAFEVCAYVIAQSGRRYNGVRTA